MVRHCVANNCTSRDVDHVPGVQLHKFPADPVMREKWIKAIGRDEWVPCGNSRLCSRHFEKDCYTMSPFQQMVLKKTAEPTIFNLSPENDAWTKKDFLKAYIPRAGKSDEVKKRSRSRSKSQHSLYAGEHNVAVAAAAAASTSSATSSLELDAFYDGVFGCEPSQKRPAKKKPIKDNKLNDNTSAYEDFSYFVFPESHFICG